MDVVVAEDAPALLSYLKEMNKKLAHIKNHVTSLNEYVLSSGLDSKSEVDLLELKNELLLSYIINLSHLMLIKCGASCDSLPGHAAVDRLVEIRTFLEKMRPLEQRFSYQLDKLLRTASSGFTSGGGHPLQFKPVPENLVSKEESSKVDSEDETLGEDRTGLYVPPRVVAMPYKEGNNQQFNLAQGKSRLVSELRDELTDLPAEVQTFDRGFIKKRKQSDDNLRESYEENHMMRLTNRRKSRDFGRTSREELEDLVDFSLFKGLTKQGRGKRRAIKKRGV